MKSQNEVLNKTSLLFCKVANLKMIKSRKVKVIILFCHQVFIINAQSIDINKPSLKIDLEIKPRAEFTNNYRFNTTESFNSRLYAIQRNRIQINFQTKNLIIHASPQEIHLFNKVGANQKIGALNAYELYIEPKLTKNSSIRIGRLGISLDNGRLYSDSPWAQQAQSHEGLRYIFKNDLQSLDIIGAFTRKYYDPFEVAFSPVASHKYKYLLVANYKKKVNQNWTYSVLNTVDFYDNPALKRTGLTRFTSGGRLEYFANDFYATLNAHYQFGKNVDAKVINAFYLQPEISYNSGKFRNRLGAEIMSGEAETIMPDHTKAFVPLYGVAWKFMGNMNFYTKFPADVNSKGLVDPYLFVFYDLNKKLTLRADFHLFYSQYTQKDAKKNELNKFLGFENDLSFQYKARKNIDINFGFSFYKQGESMVLLKKTKSVDVTPVWSYLSVSFRPNLLHKNFKRK
jgi:hypothetical protein